MRIILIIGFLLCWVDYLQGQTLDSLYRHYIIEGEKHLRKGAYTEAERFFSAAKYCLLPKDENYDQKVVSLDSSINAANIKYRTELTFQKEQIDTLSKLAQRDAVFIRSIFLAETANKFLKKRTIDAYDDAVAITFQGLDSIRKHNEYYVQNKEEYALVKDSFLLLKAFGNALFKQRSISKKNIHVVKNNLDGVANLYSFTPTFSDSLFLTIGRDKKIKLWNISGDEKYEYSHPDYILTSELSKDEKYILLGTKDGHVKIIDWIEQKEVFSKILDFPITKAAFLGDNNKIIVLGRSVTKPITILNVEENIDNSIIPNKWNQAPFLDIVFSGNGNRFFIHTLNQLYAASINNFDFAKIEPQDIAEKQFYEIGYKNNQLELGVGKRIKLSDSLQYSLNNSLLKRNGNTIKTGITCMDISISQQKILAGDDLGNLYIWDVDGRLLMETELLEVGFIKYVANKKDRIIVITSSNDLYTAPFPHLVYQKEKMELGNIVLTKEMQGELTKIDSRNN